jgi:small subunit ribosomal protein S16
MLRLKRVGRRNDPSYRIVVVDKRTGPKSGKYVDELGSYQPKPGAFSVDVEKARRWLSVGVKLSDTVHNMFVTKGIIDASKINAPLKKTVAEKEEVVSETSAKSS